MEPEFTQIIFIAHRVGIFLLPFEPSSFSFLIQLDVFEMDAAASLVHRV